MTISPETASASPIQPHSPSDHPEPFLVDLGGVVSILSESIYTGGREVFVRELLQNGQDAITARQLMDPAFRGGMILERVTDASGQATLVVEDNGIGLTIEESRRALSTIALSLKKVSGASADDSPFVGRFGIGLLSGFLVADEITVISRRTGSDSPSVHWVGRIDGTFTARPSLDLAEPGTRVYLRLRPDAANEFSADNLFEIAQKYGRYLPHPITFRRGPGTALVNDEAPLWRRPMELDGLLEHGSEIFEQPLLSAFPFQSDAAAAQGIAFIQAEGCHANAEASHVLFIKHMLVSERALDLEPPNAPFLRVILNSDALRPNAGRDAVMSNDSRLPLLRTDIEQAFKQHLQDLHRRFPDRCGAIVRAQHRCLSVLAAKDRFYLGFLLDYLPLETTLGPMTLGQVFRRHTGCVEFVTDGRDFQRLQARAQAEGDCIACVETDASHRLMELVSSATGGNRAARITSREYLARFTQNSGCSSQREGLVLAALSAELTKENCTGVFCESDDEAEIARLEIGTEESLDRLLSLDHPEACGVKKLLLNRLHPIILQITGGAVDAEQMRVWLRVFYHLALLQAREVPTAAESRRFSQALSNAFTASTLNLH